MIRRERLTAQVDGDFVVFLIGMRINNFAKPHKWLPVVRAMPRMIKELHRRPESGFLAAETWFARTIIVVQYWRSLEQLLAYAKDRNSEHLPAWRDFNKAVGVDGTVGIWHETYLVPSGNYENVYVNMPRFGLGRAGELNAASGGKQSAAGRMRANRGGSQSLDDPAPVPRA